MRILNVYQTYAFFGKNSVTSKILPISRSLAGRGHEVGILCVDYGKFHGVSQSQSEGVEITYLGRMLPFRNLTLSWDVLPFCFKRLRNFHLVHIYGLYDLLGPAVAWFCRRWGIPYVVEPMGMYRPIVRSLLKKRLYHWLLGRALVRGARCLIATSEQERQELVEEGIGPDEIVVRRNGLDLEEFQGLPPRGAFRQELGVPDEWPLVLYLGRLSRKKGLDMLLRAFAALRAPAHLAIVGPDDRDGCVPELERMRVRLGLQDRVTLVGARFGAEKLKALVDADLFVLPSRNENFGNAAAEALACGVPVIVTDQCGIAPLVAGRAGIVVEYRQEALEEALRRLVTDHGFREGLRAECRAVARGLSWEEPIAQMEQLYASMAGQAAQAGTTA